MDLANAPYFALLKSRLSALAERQKLVAENIANASTPGFRPRDLDMKAFNAAMQTAAQSVGVSGGLSVQRTQPGHMSPGGGGGSVARVPQVDAETTLDGNAVVLEDQMMRAAETRVAYETGLALYQKGLQLVRMAARGPGR
jgi:flagellar basal-body rod protein FlgB